MISCEVNVVLRLPPWRTMEDAYLGRKLRCKPSIVGSIVSIPDSSQALINLVKNTSSGACCLADWHY